MQLMNQVAVVTGSGSGIGEAIAKLFALNGSKVVIADWHEEDGRRVAHEICQTNQMDSAIYVKADVSSETQVQALIAQALTVYGRIDIVVNNAATILPKELEHVEEHEWDRLMNINLKSVYLMAKHTIKELRLTGGRMINMASLNGLIGQRKNAVYAASKGAVIAMTKALALDYASDGIRVNCICPAGVMTPLLEEWVNQQPNPEETRHSLTAMHPLGRPATTDEIAKAALFLASNQSSFMTGVALPVEGGASLGY